MRLSPGLGTAGLIGLAVAALGVTSPGRAALRELISAWAGFAVLRDGQQYVAALALAEAIGLGAGVASVATRGSSCTTVLPDGGAARLPTAAGQGGAALGVVAVLAPVLLLPGWHGDRPGGCMRCSTQRTG